MTFCSLSWEGTITKQLPSFIIIIAIILIGHFVWLAVLYGTASIYSGKSGLEVLKNYGPAYLTAIGTMSSAATLAVALESAGKSKNLRKDVVDFGIPLFANIHLCGSVLTEVFFVMAVSKVLYGQLPSLIDMILFCSLLGVFAIGAPGVPGGTVMASLGLLTGILGFNADGTALMLAVFALQGQLWHRVQYHRRRGIDIDVDRIRGQTRYSGRGSQRTRIIIYVSEEQRCSLWEHRCISKLNCYSGT